MASAAATIRTIPPAASLARTERSAERGKRNPIIALSYRLTRRAQSSPQAELRINRAGERPAADEIVSRAPDMAVDQDDIGGAPSNRGGRFVERQQIGRAHV